MSADLSAPGSAPAESLFSRLARMSGDELRCRLAQAVSKRVDVARDVLRLAPASSARAPNPVAPVFFFGPDDIAGIAKRIRQQLPEEVKALADRADRLSGKRFDLLGYRDLDFGDPINWSLDPVSGRQAPRRRWPAVPYLDYAVVGDHKVVWELSRHQHLVTLARAWRITGENKYVDEALAQFRHWSEENRYPWGIHWTSALEVAFRLVSWVWLRALLDGKNADHYKAQDELLDGIGLSARYVERYLSTYFSPNTHLLGEAFALYVAGLACPELQDAERWRTTGREILLEQAEKQVRADGMHFEQSIYYHVYSLDFFLHFKVLNDRAGTPVPERFDRTLESMCELLAAVSQGGAPPRFGDDDGGRLFDGARNRAAHMLDPLATAAAVFERPDWKAAAPSTEEMSTEEMLWLIGPELARKYEAMTPKPADPTSRRHDESGLHVLVSSEKQPRALVVDAGPLGSLGGGHGHADALSFVWSQGGRDWLVDPGAGRYPVETAERNAFRSTAAHSTLTIDGQSQAEPAGPFGWAALPETRTEVFAAGRRADVFIGTHHGYERLSPPVTHRRTIVQFKDGLCFVRDQALGSGQRPISVLWRPASELSLRRLTDEHVVLADAEHRSLAFVAPRSSDWRREVSDGEYAPAYGAKIGAPVVEYTATLDLPAELGVFLVAGREADTEDEGVSAELYWAPGVASRYDYQADGELTSLWFADADEWSKDGWKTDAAVLCWRQSAAGRCLIAVGATHLEWRKSSFFKAADPVEIFECWSDSGGVRVHPTATAGARTTAVAQALEAVKVHS